MKPSPFDPSVRNVDRTIAFLRDAVLALPPGHEAQFARELLYFPAPPGFMPADWILEGIVGACYEFSHRQDEVTGNTIFRRRVKPFDPSQGLRTYVSPDRRHLVTQRFDGVFVSPGGGGAEQVGGGGAEQVGGGGAEQVGGGGAEQVGDGNRESESGAVPPSEKLSE